MIPFSSVERLERRLLHALDVGSVADVDAVAADDAAPFHLRLNAGGRTYVDSSGYTWESDRIGRGGRKGRRVYDVGSTRAGPITELSIGAGSGRIVGAHRDQHLRRVAAGECEWL